MAQPLTDAINALTQYANTVTGASDQTLSEAVATLASGYGGGGGVANFLEPKDMIGTMTVDENKALALRSALSSVAVNTLVIGFCSTAEKYKILLLNKRANNNVSLATGFSSNYGTTEFSISTWTNNNLGIGDVYYLFTGINF